MWAGKYFKGIMFHSFENEENYFPPKKVFNGPRRLEVHSTDFKTKPLHCVCVFKNEVLCVELKTSATCHGHRYW